MNGEREYSERDQELLTMIGMDEEQMLADERMAESGTIPGDLAGCRSSS